MKKLITFFGLRFRATQYKWARQLFGGTWHYINVTGVGVIYWTDNYIPSCQSKIITTENY